MTPTAKVLQTLRAHESRNITFMEADGSWPIVWDRARGLHVWDAEGRQYLDLTAAFGVAAAGHANPRVVRAGQRQLARLPHAMGQLMLTMDRWPRLEARALHALSTNPELLGDLLSVHVGHKSPLTFAVTRGPRLGWNLAFA